MIRFDDLSLARAGRPLFSHASLIINPGERVALIGANGSGKSSLLALLRGDLAPEQGNVDLPRLRIAWLAQHAPRASIGPVRFVMNADAALVAAEQAIQQAEARHDGEALGEAEESSEESPLFSAMIAMTAMSITTMTAAIAPIMRPVFGPFFFGCPP